MTGRRVFVLSPLFAALAACGNSVALPTPGTPQAAARDALMAPRTGEYALGPGDKLRVVVFNEEQLSGEYTVDPGGRISVPLAGTIQAGGRSTVQLSTDIGARLRAGNFLRDPNVSVQVLQTRPFYVLGEVQRPGEFAYRPGLSITAAVAMAGGFTFRANQGRALVSRQGINGEVPVETGAGVVIEPGDVVRVVERFL